MRKDNSSYYFEAVRVETEEWFRPPYWAYGRICKEVGIKP